MRVSIPEDIQEIMRQHAKDLDSKLPKGMAFAIFLAPFGDANSPTNDWVLYISNAVREDMMRIVSTYLSVEGH